MYENSLESLGSSSVLISFQLRGVFYCKNTTNIVRIIAKKWLNVRIKEKGCNYLLMIFEKCKLFTAING